MFLGALFEKGRAVTAADLTSGERTVLLRLREALEIFSRYRGVGRTGFRA